MTVVTRRSAMQWSPVGPEKLTVNKSFTFRGSHLTWHQLYTELETEQRYRLKKTTLHSPAVTVRRTDIGPDTNQKVYHIVVAPADGIVKGSDAFIIGLAGVAHLSKNILHSAFIIV